MGLYGPFTATAGTVQRCDVDSDAGGLYFLNTCRFDLMIAFGASQPPNSTSFGGPPYYATVPAGDRRGIRIPSGIYGGAGFPGYVWVLPIDNSGQLAITGTIGGAVQFSIETYADPIAMPPDYASAQFQSMASQQRVISIPIQAGAFESSFAGTAANGVVAKNVGSAPSANNLANLQAKCYMLWASLEAFSTAAAFYAIDYEIDAMSFDGAGNMIQKVALYSGWLAIQPNTSAHTLFNPAFPVRGNIVWTQGNAPASLGLALTQNSTLGGNAAVLLRFIASFGYDQVNANSPGIYGGIQLGFSVATPSSTNPLLF